MIFPHLQFLCIVDNGVAAKQIWEKKREEGEGMEGVGVDKNLNILKLSAKVKN